MLDVDIKGYRNGRSYNYEEYLSRHHQESWPLEIPTHAVRICDILPHGSATKSTDIWAWIVLKTVPNPS